MRARACVYVCVCVCVFMGVLTCVRDGFDSNAPRHMRILLQRQVLGLSPQAELTCPADLWALRANSESTQEMVTSLLLRICHVLECLCIWTLMPRSF